MRLVYRGGAGRGACHGGARFSLHGKLKHAPPMRRNCLEMSKLQSRAKLGPSAALTGQAKRPVLPLDVEFGGHLYQGGNQAVHMPFGVRRGA